MITRYVCIIPSSASNPFLLLPSTLPPVVYCFLLIELLINPWVTRVIKWPPRLLDIICFRFFSSCAKNVSMLVLACCDVFINNVWEKCVRGTFFFPLSLDRSKNARCLCLYSWYKSHFPFRNDPTWPPQLTSQTHGECVRLNRAVAPETANRAQAVFHPSFPL